MINNCFKDINENYIIFSFHGEIFSENSSAILNQIMTDLHDHPQRKIIVDLTSIGSEFYLLDYVHILRMIGKEFSNTKIAIVDKTKDKKESEIIEVVLSNSGITFELFKSLPEAVDWMN